jgi:hypothetical protein
MRPQGGQRDLELADPRLAFGDRRLERFERGDARPKAVELALAHPERPFEALDLRHAGDQLRHPRSEPRALVLERRELAARDLGLVLDPLDALGRRGERRSSPPELLLRAREPCLDRVQPLGARIEIVGERQRARRRLLAGGRDRAVARAPGEHPARGGTRSSRKHDDHDLSGDREHGLLPSPVEAGGKG